MAAGQKACFELYEGGSVLAFYDKLTEPRSGHRLVVDPGDPPRRRPAEDASKPTAETTTMASNIILYGPPGTGKTYATIDEAVKLVDPGFVTIHGRDRAALKTRFDELVKAGRVRFVTFHQSLSYEDFVEGLRAVSEPEDEGGPATLSYRVEPGVFRQLCEAAMRDEQVDEDLGVRDGARLWKLSLDGTGPSQTRDYCYSHGEARIGWGHVGDLASADLTREELKLGSNDRHSLNCFAMEVEPGDVILSIRSNREVGAVGIVTGAYRFDPHPPASVKDDYGHVLPVRWLATDLSLDLRELNEGKLFTLKTFYPLLRLSWPKVAGALELHRPGAVALRKSYRAEALPHVLVIDEINRGNVSRIFGELLTLIEPGKRAGQPEALEVTLPYSRQRFSVPSNVHLIGTMNTADRSLAGLDIALRRRFTFKEMAPQPQLLRGVSVEGVDVGELLAVMNERIEVLLNRDHALGHAYFMRLAEQGGNTLAALAQVFRGQVLPLLQEYFFEDWERIALVLNDLRKPEGRRFVYRPESNLDKLFGSDQAPKLTDRRWQIDEQAFEHIETYRRILA
jgi:5-methylcytosine-specific restriction protein B